MDHTHTREREAMAAKKPNILILWGDDIGYWNISAYNLGQMGYETPNIDRIAKEGAMFTDWYGQQSCTAGRAAFITGQSPIRTGLAKVGLPGATVGLSAEDPSIAEVMKSLGYATGQFGKKRMETIDEEFLAAATDFIQRQHKADVPWFCYFNTTRMHINTHLKKESQGKTGLGLYPDGMVETDGH